MSRILWRIALLLAPLAVAVLSVLFTVFFMSFFLEMSTLEAGSVKTKARVVESHKENPSIKNINPIRVTSVDYSFQADGKAYIGSALGSDKVGDTISILYAKEDPSVSIPARINVSEQKFFSGSAAALTLLVGIGLTVVVARILWRKVVSKTRKQR